MPEYIDRTEFRNRCNRGLRFLCDDDFRDVDNLLMAMPTADVAPVVHGQWIRQGDYCSCSECGNSGVSRLKYCSNCGARMDKGVMSGKVKEVIEND